jgi:hypothetical protein
MALKVEQKGNKLCIEIDLEKPTHHRQGKLWWWPVREGILSPT